MDASYHNNSQDGQPAMGYGQDQQYNPEGKERNKAYMVRVNRNV